MRKISVALATMLMAGLMGSLPAKATTFDFSYSGIGVPGAGYSGSGEFVATLVSGSQYNVTDVTGSETDPTGTYIITGLSLFAHADNQLYLPPSPHLATLGGIAFTTGSLAASDWNLYWSDAYGSYFLTDSGINPGGGGNGPLEGPAINFTVSAEATPLPAALPLFAGGLGVMGLLARRKKRKAFAPITTA